MIEPFMLLQGACALIGLGMLAIGAIRIYDAREERRTDPPTTHIKYSEGIWRIGVGIPLIGLAAIATFG